MADTLSRAPVRVNQVLEKPDQDSLLDIVQKQQRDDEELSLIMDYLELKSLPNGKEKAQKLLSQAHRGWMVSYIMKIVVAPPDDN